MADVLVLANDISTPIKVAWMLWLAWGLVQIGWYRRARIAAPPSQPAPHARLARHRVGPPRARSDSASTPKPSAPDVTATPSDATPPSNSAEAVVRLEHGPPPPTPEVASPVTNPPEAGILSP